MTSLKTSTLGLITVFAMLAGAPAQASSYRFLCGEETLTDIFDVPAKRRTEPKLAFYLEDDELLDLDKVVESYLTMTHGYPKAVAPHRQIFGDVVLEADLWQGPFVTFKNTHELVFENAKLMENLLNESREYRELVRENQGKKIQLRRTLRTVR